MEHDIGGGQNTGPSEKMAQQKQYMTQHSRFLLERTGCLGEKLDFLRFLL